MSGIAAARDAGQGAAIFWDGGGTGFGWSSNVLGLATGDDLTFVDPVNTPVGKRLGMLTNDTAVTSLNSLTFNASAGAITLDGSQIGLAAGGLTNNSTRREITSR